MLMIATLAQSSDFPLSIFVGYACAMVTQSVIALIVGKGISRGAERFGPLVEVLVGVILTATGATKIALMIFVGEVSIDNIFGGGDGSALFSFSSSSSSSSS
eukprot:TRINITY_DN98_c1_g2_i4.p1 TRINITY_DN98_c1_g2~~TRINITY_DN98_c1_g2_i4.p1  ORF type:complete len:102 (+),score=26.64 TRINITY_DN98_c1_g2_i4:248-553(+)